MPDWRPGASIETLRERAQVFAAIRAFFAERDVLEVDTPLLASFGVSDPAIEPLRAAGDVGTSPRFLQTSPEYAMKRLLAAGSGPIYQLGKAFRDGEHGARHNPEFTLLEWYRPDFDLPALMDEVAALLGACLGRSAYVLRDYSELFREHLNLDPLEATSGQLTAVARRHLDCDRLRLDRDGWLDLLMSHCIEPALRDQGLVFVTHYPPSQAALAQIGERDGRPVALRFELYCDGIELANGYRELLDPEELERRAQQDNRLRRAAGLECRALDPHLLAAMRAGLPPSCGVALGVDRLLMSKLGLQTLAEVMPFSWERS